MTGLPPPRTEQRAVRFLGPQASAGGPFALLDLLPGQTTNATVIAALEQQLEQVNSHPHSETHEADEVRLALHAAAAQLLDPGVRREMIARWSSKALPTMPIPRAPAGHTQLSPAMLALEHDAILTLAMHGGWNRQSLRRLAVLAHARGIPSDQVTRAIHAIASRRRRPQQLHTNPARAVPVVPPIGPAAAPRSLPDTIAGRPPPEPAPSDQNDLATESMETPDELVAPSHQGVRTALAAVGVGIVTLAVALGALVMLVPGRSGSASSSPIAATTPADAPLEHETPSVAESPAQADETIPPTSKAPVLRDARAMLDALDLASRGLEIDPPTAGEQVELVIETLALRWPDLTRDERIAIHAAIIEFLYRAGPWPEVASTTARTIASGMDRLVSLRDAAEGDAVMSLVWSAGMLTRLNRERNLPASIGATLDAALLTALGGASHTQDRSFEAGAADMLVRLASLLGSANISSDPAIAEHSDPWAAWLQAVRAITLGDQALAERLVLGALVQLLRDGPEPTEHAPTHDAVELLLGALDWHPDSDARRWLVRVFAAPAYSSADLHVITAVLVQRGGPLGLDLTMTLGPRASELVRRELRDRYARVWGLGRDDDADLLAEDFAVALRETLARQQRDVTPLEHFETGTILARLNAASALRWRGELDAAQDLLDDLIEPVHHAATIDQSITTSFIDDLGGDWATRYLHVGRNIQARLALLDELPSRGRLGVVDAEVLVAQAVRGNHAKVRAKARESVQAHLDDTSVLNALLEELPDLPASRANIALIEYVAGTSLPPESDKTWRIDARRALVEQLLTLVAAESELASIDRLAELIAQAYAERVGRELTSSGGRTPPAELIAAMLRSRWQQRAEGSIGAAGLDLNPAGIERQRAARSAMAGGPVQLFAAEQLAACESLAFVVAAEQPDRAGPVARVLDELQRQRRRTNHILVQIAAVERAMAQLWAIRLKEDLP